MELFEMIDLEGCPKCGGVGYLEDEGTSGVSIYCIDCGAHTVDITYKTPEDKPVAAQKAADLWNSGKALTSERGE